MTSRTVFLVDGANIEISARELGVKRIDYGKFRDVLLKELKSLMKDRDITLVRPYYYDSWDGSKEREKFLDELQRIGYDLQGILRCEPTEGGSHRQKGVDIKMAVDLVHFAETTPVDVIVICSGDMDFKPALEVAKYTLKRVIVACFEHSGSEELIRSADGLIDLTPLVKRFKS